MPTLLVTGASGTLGQHVAAQASQAGWHVIGTHLTRQADLAIEWRSVDIRDRPAVEALVAATRPAAIVHTAYRQRGDDLWDVCATGSAHVASAATRADCRLVHISSDMVFDGRQAPYAEAARPAPISPYGAAKAAAETAVAALAPRAAIVRTSLIVSRHPLDPQQQAVLDVLDGRASMAFFTDEWRNPVAVEALAAGVLELAGNDLSGIINIAGAECLSRHQLACLVAVAHNRDPGAVPAATLEGSGLVRPANLELDLTMAGALLRSPLVPISAYLTAPPH
jgi:dTDP-4-dehydrorhamnose reductase